MPRTPGFARIADDIRSKIKATELKPGDRLPTQAQLASEYGVSLQPVKLALKILETEGLVIGHQGKGVFVSEPGDSA